MNRGERGAALVTTLLISLMIIAVSMLVTSLVRGKIGTAREIKAGLQAAVQAENLLQETIFLLSTHRFKGAGIEWSEKGKTTQWPFDGSPIALNDGNVHIQDTSGILPLWPFDSGKLKRLLDRNGIDESDSCIFLDSLADWLDEDDLKHLNGAERAAYRKMGVDYGPRNDYWQSREELLLVCGMTPDIWQVIEKEMLFVFGYNINPLILRESLVPVILNGEETKIAQFLALRKSGQLNYRTFFALFPEYSDRMDITFSPLRHLIICATAVQGDISCTKEATISFVENRRTPFQLENRRAVEFPGSDEK